MKKVLIALGLASMAISGSAVADLALAKKSGCMACHSVDKKIVGPSWHQVADRYRDDPDARAKLAVKIKKGGKGVWGSAPMPPYSPRVSDADIEKLVDFIMTL